MCYRKEKRSPPSFWSWARYLNVSFMSLQGTQLGEDRLRQLAGIKPVLLYKRRTCSLEPVQLRVTIVWKQWNVCQPVPAVPKDLNAACESAVTQFALGEHSSSKAATTCEGGAGSRTGYDSRMPLWSHSPVHPLGTSLKQKCDRLQAPDSSIRCLFCWFTWHLRSQNPSWNPTQWNPSSLVIHRTGNKSIKNFFKLNFVFYVRT